MEEEKKETTENKEETKLSFKTADELTSFLMDLQGQMTNMQQTIDKLAPVEENAESKDEEKEEKEEMTDEEISEIDKLLQSE